MNEAALEGGGGGLGAVVDLEFAEDMADVEFDGDFGDGEGGGDFLVAAAFDDEAEDFNFPRGQVGVSHAFSEAGADGRGNGAFAGMDFADGVNQFVAHGSLKEISSGAGLEGAIDVFLAVMGG